MMEYKGYVAEVEYVASARIFYGRVSNTAPYSIATFEVEQESELRPAFEETVDDYLAWCAEDGVEPLRPLPIAGNVAADADAREPQPAVGAGDGD